MLLLITQIETYKCAAILHYGNSPPTRDNDIIKTVSRPEDISILYHSFG